MGSRRDLFPKESFCFSGTIEELECWRAMEREAHPGGRGFTLSAMIRAMAVRGPARRCVAGVWLDDPSKPVEVRFFSGSGATRASRMRDAHWKARHFLPDQFLRGTDEPSDYLGYSREEWHNLHGDDAVLWGPAHRMEPRRVRPTRASRTIEAPELDALVARWQPTPLVLTHPIACRRRRRWPSPRIRPIDDATLPLPFSLSVAA